MRENVEKSNVEPDVDLTRLSRLARNHVSGFTSTTDDIQKIIVLMLRYMYGLQKSYARCGYNTNQECALQCRIMRFLQDEKPGNTKETRKRCRIVEHTE